MNKKYTLLQKISFGYAVAFFLIVLLNYIPAIHDENGYMFGAFHLDLIDDLLHLGSAIWAVLAAYASAGAVRFYFKTFGTIYFLDGVSGILIGKGFLDGALFNSNVEAVAEWGVRIGINIPHIIIGGSMMIFGFVLCRVYSNRFMGLDNEKTF